MRSPGPPTVLISGAGIAGPSLAFWLARYGWLPTIVECAPVLRTGGYMIDFWGAGFEVARRMGVASEILRRGYAMRGVRAVDRAGRRISGFSADVFVRATRDGFTSLPRGDLAAILHQAIAGQAETLFDDSIVHLDQTPTDVRVTFRRNPRRAFDLVVGADGLHSRVRELAFGPSLRFERYLGIKVAAFLADGYRPRDELVYVMFSGVGFQVARVAMRDDRTMFLFTFADADAEVPTTVADQKSALVERFRHRGWECDRILDALAGASDVYFDRVSQIEMPRADGLWARGRVVLTGDAAFCISLLGGQGAALAMTAAYVLAGELHRAGVSDFGDALERYQRLMGPFVAGKQRAARRFAGAFAPSSRFALFLRNQIFRVLSVPPLARLVAGRGFSDRLALPTY